MAADARAANETHPCTITSANTRAPARPQANPRKDQNAIHDRTNTEIPKTRARRADKQPKPRERRWVMVSQAEPGSREQRNIRRATTMYPRPRASVVAVCPRAALGIPNFNNFWPFLKSGPRGVTVSTLDPESSDRGSNPREAFHAGSDIEHTRAHATRHGLTSPEPQPPNQRTRANVVYTTDSYLMHHRVHTRHGTRWQA